MPPRRLPWSRLAHGAATDQIEELRRRLSLKRGGEGCTLRNATHCGPVFQIHERCVFERDDTMGHVFERENIKGGGVQEIGARWGEGV